MYTIKLNIGSWSSPVVGGGYILANPYMDGIRIVKKRDSDFRQVVRVKVDGDFIYYNDPNGNSEFDVLRTLRESGDTFIDARIYFNGSQRMSGKINLNTGSEDFNKKLLYVAFQANDEYTDLLSESTTKFNIKKPGVETVKFIYNSQIFDFDSSCTALSVLAYQTAFDPAGNVKSSRVDEWDLYTLINTTPCTGGNIYTFRTAFLPFASGVYVENHYMLLEAIKTSPPYLRSYKDYGLGKPSSAPYTSIQGIPYCDMTEFVKLYDLIKYILGQIDTSISISESTYCTYFTVDKPEYNYIMIADKSDVINWDASNPASFENTTFADLMEMLKLMFNIDWFIDDGVFKLRRPESLSLPSFTTYPKHDFTVISNGEDITNNQRLFRWLVDNKVNKEIWTYDSSYYFVKVSVLGGAYTDQPNYITSRITYDSFDENVSENNLISINPNVEYLAGDFDEDIILSPPEKNDIGFVFIATELLGGVRIISFDYDSSLGFWDQYFKPNYIMSAEYLTKTHQLTDRPYNSGEIDGVTTSLTKRPDKEYTFMNVPVWDIDDIDFDYLVKTADGNITPESLDIDITLKTFTKFVGVG